MNVNDHFNDYPIDYFKISHENLMESFPAGHDTGSAEENYERALERFAKDIIEPNAEGKVFDSLRSKLDLQDQNTCVINIGVGQGKTYTILKIVEEYFRRNSDTYILIAVPYVSLVEQYVQELMDNGIPEGDIYRYEWLNPKHGNLSQLNEQLKRRVHVVTANCLLGNAGEDAVLNSKIKRNYLEEFPAALAQKKWIYEGAELTEEEVQIRFDKLELVQIEDGDDVFMESHKDIFDYSKLSFEVSSKKVVLIFDELHDAVHNFTDNNILNLYHWKDILQKIFLLSATFDDSSLVVVNQLSLLTDRKIQILESERKAIRATQSDLYIHFDNNYNFKNENSKIVELVKNAIEAGNKIDILCYSKILAEDLFDGEVGNLLKLYSDGNVKLCASELIANQRATIDEAKNRYDHDKINIGTNFKTGININKENHCFIIILPAKNSKSAFKNFYGIFSNGYLDIVQALARQRRKGEIHVLTMFHENIALDSLPTNWSVVQKNSFESEITRLGITTVKSSDLSRHECHNLDGEDIVKYSLLNSQSKIIKDKYEEIMKPNLVHAVHTHLDFIRNKEDFRTEIGKKALMKDRFFGQDLSANLTINAYTNQYLNCRLVETYGSIILISDDDFDERINDLFRTELNDSQLSPLKLFDLLVNNLFANKVKYNNKSVTKSSAPKLQKKLANFILRQKSSIPPSGENLKSQDLIQHIMNDGEINSSSEAIPMLKKVFENLKGIIIEDNGHKYLPTNNKEIFSEIDVDILYSAMIKEFPIFVELGYMKKLSNGTIIQKKNALYNIIHKCLGQFGESDKSSFHESTMKKIVNESEILTRLFS